MNGEIAIRAFEKGKVYLKIHGVNGALHVDEKGKVQAYSRRNSKGKPKPKGNVDLYNGSFL